MASWYYVKEGERVGPLSREALDGRIADGDVRADTLVWSVGMVWWVGAELVGELAVPPAPAPTRAERPAETPEEGPGETTWEAVETTRPPVDLPVMAEALKPAGALVAAGLGARVVAKLVDTFILFVIGGVVQRWLAGRYFDGEVPLMTEDFDRWVEFVTLFGPINLVIVLSYLIFFIRRYDATPGKRLMGLKLLRPDGRSLGVGRIIGRHFAEQLSILSVGVGYVMAFFDTQRRTLHDFICSTRVVKDERRRD